MGLIFCSVLSGFVALALYYACKIFHKQNFRKQTYQLLTMMAMASALWCLGDGYMQVVQHPICYAFCRAISMFGIIMYIMSGQIIIALLANTRETMRFIAIGELVAGLYVMGVYTNPANYILVQGATGLLAEFTSTRAEFLYNGYMTGSCLVFVVINLRLLMGNYSKANKAMARTLMTLALLVMGGFVLEALIVAMFPGYSIPLCTVLEFFGLNIFYRAIVRYNAGVISISNLTDYVYRSLKTPVFLVNRENRMVVCNQQALEDFGIEKALDNPLRIWEDVFGRIPPELHFGQEIGGSREVNLEYHEESLRLDLDPIYDEFGEYQGYIVVVANITDAVKNAQLEENTRMKTLFLANMSHEIRTPLNAILGFNDALIQNPGNQEKVSKYANHIKEAGESLKDIINSILDISKIEMGQLAIENREYNTVELLDGVCSMFEMLAHRKGLDFYTVVDERLPEYLVGDESHIRQVLTNLLSNAVKYTDSGSVTLKVWVAEEYPGNSNRKIHFSVKDTGRGIKKEDRSRLFEKFERLDSEHFKHIEGTGLGMNIVQHTLQAMNSDILFESTFGIGSKFYFDLLQKAVGTQVIGNFQERRRILAEQATVGNDFRSPNAKVLLVDDVVMNLEAVQAMMEFAQMQIDTATSGAEAITLVQQKHYHIIFMDHMMPEMDGIQTTEAIRSLAEETGDLYYETVPIIALTANTMAGVNELYQKAGMQDFVSKPIEMKTMIQVLMHWLPEELIQKASNAEMEEQARQRQGAQNAGLESSGKRDWMDVQEDLMELGFGALDLDEARKYQAEVKNFEQSLKSYCKAYEENQSLITSFYDAKDLGNYVIRVHGLKSSSKLIGAMKLSEQARELEELGNKGEWNDAAQEQLLADYASVVDCAKAYLNRQKQQKGLMASSAQAKPMLLADYNALMQKILDAAEVYDMERFLHFEEELEEISPPAEYEKQFGKLKQLIMNLCYGEVADLILGQEKAQENE